MFHVEHSAILQLSACDCPDYEERLRPRGDRIGQWSVWRLVREVFFAGEEAKKRAALLRPVVTNRATQHGIASLKRIQHRALGHWRSDVKFHFVAHLGKHSQMLRQYDSNHRYASV